jgi:glycosyltransferase involved in cell wall biosynthesis
VNVLVLTSSFPRNEQSHEVRYIFDLAESLTHSGFVPFVLTPHYSGGKSSELWGNVHVERFSYFFPSRYEKLAYGFGILYNLQKYPVAILNVPFFLLSEMFFSLLIIYSKKINLIHSHWFVPQGFIGALFQSFLGIPHVATIHGSDLNTMKNNPLLRRLCPFIVRNSDLITVNSTFMKHKLESLVPDSGKKIMVIPMGISPVRYQDLTSADADDRKSMGHIVLCVGRLIDLKGTIYLIDAMPRVSTAYPDATLLIIGDGPERETLENRVRDLGIEKTVKFLGIINPADLPPYYHSADVFVLPSITKDGKTEALGVVLLEAMASGCPVIGSNVGGIPDIITDGENGFLVPEQRPDSIAEKIVRIFSDTELQERFRRNGLIRVQESFSWVVIAKKFSEVYCSALENGGKKPSGMR